ncbi:hypothetical protein [Lactobacillus helveticus]|uniref:hypothetical protein n=1 Tax=Lactobacillus helveticus TaxID=1587 RepID=UPI001565AC20|nr:hypothetical protein [Lactobacillus helveticus]NRO92553.1 hypothetical protein [Lactobacillus helveticus]
MKHKFLAVTLSSIMLFSDVALTSSMPVSAAVHSINSSFWNKNRKVIVDKTTRFRKFDKRRNRYVRGTKKYTPGDVIKVRAAGEFKGWVLAGTRPGSRYWWVSTKKNSKWMDEYFKEHNEKWSGKTYTDLYGNKFTIKKLQRVSVMNYDNESGKPDEVDLVLSGKLSNNYYKRESPKSWLDENLSIYPTGTNDDHILLDDTSNDDLLLPNDEEHSDDFAEHNDKLSKDYYTSFKMVLSGDKQDLNAKSYTFDDGLGHKIDVPVEDTTETVDIED